MRLHLKLARIVVLSDFGRLFQSAGPATEKAQSPNLVPVRGTVKLHVCNNQIRASALMQGVLAGKPGPFGLVFG